jgi:hypothetical protein
MDQAPRSLDKLLSSMKTCSDNLTSLDQIDQLIQDYIWARKFKTYLKKRELEDEIHILKFLVAQNQLEWFEVKFKAANLKAKQLTKLQADRKTLFNLILNGFFNEEFNSNCVLPLSNDSVFDALTDLAGQPDLNPGRLEFDLLNKAQWSADLIFYFKILLKNDKGL